MSSIFVASYVALQKRLEVHRLEVMSDAFLSLILQGTNCAVFMAWNPLHGRAFDRDVEALLGSLHIDVSDAPGSY